MTVRTGTALFSMILLASPQIRAQEVDLDDVTMTVVREGMFEARQLERPDTAAIRELMQENGALPRLAPERPGPELPEEYGARPVLPGAIDDRTLEMMRARRPEPPAGPERPVRPRVGNRE